MSRDDVELAIVQSWLRLLPRLAADPRELARRLARRAAATSSRPPRAWCLALRASDTRLNRDEGRGMRDERAADADADAHPGHPSSLTLSPADVARLCAPVTLDPPGGTLDEVARTLGVSKNGLLRARVDKILRQHYVEGLGGYWGHPRPIVYTDAELDPGARGFAMPDPAWSWTAAGAAGVRPSM